MDFFETQCIYTHNLSQVVLSCDLLFGINNCHVKVLKESKPGQKIQLARACFGRYTAGLRMHSGFSVLTLLVWHRER